MTSVTSDVYGCLPGGFTVKRFCLQSESVKVEIISFGCIITCLETKDRHGNFSDIVLGFDYLEGYTNKHPYFGAVIGRVANRIAKGRFTVDSKDYFLPINNGPNSIHGGLKGFDKGSENIYDHEISIDADHYLPVDDTMIPTGDINPVEGTYFDLRKPVILGSQIAKLQESGFDHNFCLKESKRQQTCARVWHNPSGRVLSVRTTQPGVQLYTANFLDGSLKGKGGAKYGKHSAFCLETQAWPDAVNKPQFPDIVLHCGEQYDQTTCYQFSVE